MTYVTCPTLRYHPAVVAQKAATLGLLSDGRFQLGVGAGENLNEHVVGERWPAVGERHDMLEEAVEIIRELLDRRPVDHRRRATSRWTPRGSGTCPTSRCRSRSAICGADSIARFAPLVDHLVAVEPDADAIAAWDDAAGTACRVAQDRPGRRSAGTRTRRPPSPARTGSPLVRRRLEGERGPADDGGFDAASQFVRPEDVAEQIPCGPDLDAIVEAVSAYWEAGFTDVAIVQVGDERAGRVPATAAGPLLKLCTEARGAERYGAAPAAAERRLRPTTD